MTRKNLAIQVICILFIISSPLYSDQWNQWLGPKNNSLAPSSPPLKNSWPDNKPTLVWESEKVPADMKADYRSGGKAGGWGSVVVANGKAYVYVNLKYQELKQERTIAAQDLSRMGWSRTPLPPELRERVEKARLSDERANLNRRRVRNWVNGWKKSNLSAPERKKFDRVVHARLALGRRALPFDALNTLSTIINKEYKTQDALKSWLKQNNFSSRQTRTILSRIKAYREIGRDVVYCFNGSDGKTIWKKDLPGRAYNYPASCTPCIADNRCYVVGSNAQVYCFNATSGDVIWQSKTQADPAWKSSTSFMIIDNHAVVLAKHLTAFDKRTGKIVWTQPKLSGKHNSAVTWKKNGKTYLVCNSEKLMGCVDPSDGSLLWSVPGGGYSTAVVNGDYAAVLSNNKSVGLSAYKISTDSAEKLWSVTISDRGASPVIYKGHVYAVGGRGKARFVCVNLESGRVMWDQRVTNTEFSTPVAADDKLIAVIKNELFLIKATPEKYTVLANAPLKLTTCTSPAFVNGRIYVRRRESIACYDLTR